ERAGHPRLASNLVAVHPLELELARRIGQQQPSDRRPVKPGQTIEDRRFSCAVRADDRRDLRRHCIEGHVIHRHQAAEAHGEVLDPQQRRYRTAIAHAAPPVCGRSARRIVGSRCASKPCGRQIMISTMAAPKVSMRNSENSRATSGSSVRNAAASTMPAWLPMPPRTTMARMTADSMKLKLSGLMKPWRVAKKAPAKPPNMAPMAKAVSLVLVGLMPSALQAI